MTGLEILPESLLTGCIPDLQFDSLPTNVDYSGTKLHTNSVVGVLFNCTNSTHTLVTKAGLEQIHSLRCLHRLLLSKEKLQIFF